MTDITDPKPEGKPSEDTANGIPQEIKDVLTQKTSDSDLLEEPIYQEDAQVVEIPELKEDKEPEKKVPLEEYLFNPQNVKAEFPIFIKVDKFDKQATTLPLPSAVPEYILSRIGLAPNTRLDDTPKGSEWINVLWSGSDLVPKEQMYQSALERSDSEWHQAIETEGRKLMPTSPTLPKVTGEALSGERGALRFMKFAGLGTVFSIPLWHTGIWITIKTPSDSRLLELNREMFTDKIELGRSTYGLALSATVSAFSERLINLAFENIYSTNLKTDKHLLDVISAHDIPTIIWGVACAVWNNGFQYERVCSHDPEKCNHTEQEKLDVTKILWVDKNALAPWQIAHMTRRKSNEVTMEDVERYKKESLKSQNRRIEMKTVVGDQNYSFDLHVPNIRQYFEHSNDWINSVVEGVTRALQVEPAEQERNRFITENAQSTIMRQYSHWIESVTFEENVINDQETLESLLEALSSDDDTRTRFTDEVKKYINDSVMTVVGIPSYECTACGGKQKYKAQNDSLYSIIPLDVIQTFFSLLVQKIISITRR